MKRTVPYKLLLLFLIGIATGANIALYQVSRVISRFCCGSGEFRPDAYNLFDYIFPYKIVYGLLFIICIIFLLFFRLIGSNKKHV
ncbi:MAG: hypothetical protein Q7S76_00845 [bacterium]|nr:hypothetical protein [bacterium]